MNTSSADVEPSSSVASIVRSDSVAVVILSFTVSFASVPAVEESLMITFSTKVTSSRSAVVAPSAVNSIVSVPVPPVIVKPSTTSVVLP